MGSFSIPSTPGSDREFIPPFTATDPGLSTEDLSFISNENHERGTLAPPDIIVQDDDICIGRVRPVNQIVSIDAN